MPSKYIKKDTEKKPLATGYLSATRGKTAKKRDTDSARKSDVTKAPQFVGKTAKKRAADSKRKSDVTEAKQFVGKTAKKRAADSKRKSDVTMTPQKKVVAGGTTGAKRRRDDERSALRMGGTAKKFRTSNRGD